MENKIPFIKTTIAQEILAIIALCALGLTLFQTFHVKRPKLQYETVSQVELFNKTDDLTKITLLLDTIDVLKGGKNITYYVIKVQNIGDQHLRTTDYDEGYFGITVNHGRIIQDVKLVDASTQHISERFTDLQPSYSECFVDIPRISLDRNDWYTISIAVIHEDNVFPILVPKGKIIGQKKINIITASDDSEHLSFIEKLFDRGIWINLLRAVIFLIIWILIIWVIVTSIINIAESRESIKDHKIKNEIANDCSILGFIRDDYKMNESTNISKANYYYKKDINQLNKEYREACSYTTNPANKKHIALVLHESFLNDIKKLVDIGYLIKDANDVLSIPVSAQDSIKKVIDIMKKHNRSISEYGMVYYG